MVLGRELLNQLMLRGARVQLNRTVMIAMALAVGYLIA
jgi:hypothetical protein